MADAQKRILIVGHDTHDSRRLAHFLENYDYQVVVSNSWSVALKSAGNGKVDMVIADHDRDVNGVNLARELKRTNAGIKIVMRSNLLDLETYLKVMNHGCDDCLEKSCTQEELLRVVGCVLKNRVEAHSGVN